MHDDEQAALLGLSATIVSAYVAKNAIPTADLPALIASVHASLAKLGSSAEPAAAQLEPHIPIRKSITRDALISLEDGRPYKTLKRHLAKLGLTPETYRTKWGLPPDYPMVAAGYAAQRSELAKSLGLGQVRRMRAAAQAAADEPVAQEPVVDGSAAEVATAKPKRASRGRARAATA